MEQIDRIPRNRHERIRKRAWTQLQQGNLDAYKTLVSLAMESYSIRV